MTDDLITRLKAATRRSYEQARETAGQVTCTYALKHLPDRRDDACDEVSDGHRCKWVVDGRRRHGGLMCQCRCGVAWGDYHGG